MPYKTPVEAVVKRLLGGSAIVALVGQRVTPLVPDMNATRPYVTVQTIAGGDGAALDGRNGTQNYILRLDVYATNEENGSDILAACMSRLCGDPRNAVAIWRDLPEGVQACFPVGDSGVDVESDANPTTGQSVSLWFNRQG